jgi:acetylornithine deacetylase/succinyl-diaminopimelate desuccinylase-like protein
MELSAADLAESVAQLVRIPSVNPLQTGPTAEAAGDIGEGSVAAFLAERFTGLGASEVVLDEVTVGRPNVYGFFPGRTDRLVVLDVHTDTVTVEHMTQPPFDGRIEDGCVWGRGALDTKASMGVMTAVLAAWQRAGLRPEPTLLLVGSVSEEAGGMIGAKRFRQWADERGLDVDQMIIAEPTQFAPIHGHKGACVMRVTTHGAAAHSAMPHLGANAIEAMAHVIRAYQDEHERLQSLAPETELGTSTLSVTMIEGGTGGNVIPASCTIRVGQRLVPEQNAHDAHQRLMSIARAASPLPVSFENIGPAKPDGTYGANAFYQPPDTPLAGDLARWAGTTPTVAPFGTNAFGYHEFANEMVVFGPGDIGDAHQATECVAIDDLVQLAEIYTTWLDPA